MRGSNLRGDLGFGNSGKVNKTVVLFNIQSRNKVDTRYLLLFEELVTEELEKVKSPGYNEETQKSTGVGLSHTFGWRVR